MKFRAQDSTGFLYAMKVRSVCQGSRKDRVHIPVAGTLRRDSTVKSTGRSRGSSITDTNAFPIPTESTAERGNAYATGTPRSIRSARSVSRRDG